MEMEFQEFWPTPPGTLINHSALALFAQRTPIPSSSRSIGFCVIWVCISSTSSGLVGVLIPKYQKMLYISFTSARTSGRGKDYVRFKYSRRNSCAMSRKFDTGPEGPELEY